MGLPTDCSLRMNDDERARLDRDGYVLRNKVFDAGECLAISAECERLAARLSTKKQGRKLRLGSYMLEFERELGVIAKWEPETPDLLMAIEPVVTISEVLSALARESRLMEPSKDIVGEEQIVLFTEKLNFKRARDGGAVRLHQDYAYWSDVSPVAHRVATAMLFLDEATIENGCLEVAPGSHRDGVAARNPGLGFGSREMDRSGFDEGRLVPLEAEAGSVVWFGAFLAHRSQPNRSDNDRRALLYSYQPAGHPRFQSIWRR